MVVKALGVFPGSAIQKSSWTLEKKAKPKGHQPKCPAVDLGSMKESTLEIVLALWLMSLYLDWKFMLQKNLFPA